MTKSDLELWDDHIKLGGEFSGEGSNDHSRLIALNKIDTLWDDMRTEDEIEGEIQAQVNKTAEILKIPADKYFSCIRTKRPVWQDQAQRGKLCARVG